MDMDDFKIPAKPARKSYEAEYDSLGQSAVEKLMEQNIEHIRSIFGVDANTTSLLLRHLS
ncbi:hypothetical protein C8J57DRAFT_1356567 [Mycena rebaudengoi]|nr:hypothetical protein C8J57DRAFT_1381410 [Mycena rebaudengoi]KAJ7249296.1 hypothetical protein C8J57DRAFT_1356567 [Mycena rebaudengoi]